MLRPQAGVNHKFTLYAILAVSFILLIGVYKYKHVASLNDVLSNKLDETRLQLRTAQAETAELVKQQSGLKTSIDLLKISEDKIRVQMDNLMTDKRVQEEEVTQAKQQLQDTANQLQTVNSNIESCNNKMEKLTQSLQECQDKPPPHLAAALAEKISVEELVVDSVKSNITLVGEVSPAISHKFIAVSFPILTKVNHTIAPNNNHTAPVV